MQIHLGFAEMLNMFIVMFQEKDMVCRSFPTYWTKEFFFLHLFKKIFFPEFLFNTLSDILWGSAPRF